MSEIRLVQLRRILGQDLADSAAAREAVGQSAALLAEGFFGEAAASDDVTGGESAMSYLDGRLAFFGDLISESASEAIRAEFARRLRAWG